MSGARYSREFKNLWPVEFWIEEVATITVMTGELGLVIQQFEGGSPSTANKEKVMALFPKICRLNPVVS